MAEFGDLAAYLDRIGEAAGKARKIAEKVIDTEVQTFQQSVANAIPATDRNIPDRGGLKAALSVTRYSKGDGWYGWKVEFKGTTKYGDSWDMIANVLDAGRVNCAGTGFLTKARRKLKGMDSRIEARINAELEKAENG